MRAVAAPAPEQTVSPADVARARDAVADVVRQTPVLPSQTLKECRQEIEHVIRTAAANDPFLGNNPPTVTWEGFQAEDGRVDEPRRYLLVTGRRR